MPNRAIFMFDGPNFYKNLKRAHLVHYPLDYQKLAAKLAMNREVQAILYFTSPTDNQGEPENYAAQQRFFAALRRHNIQLKLGHLRKIEKDCPLCGRAFSLKVEKSVDVQLAIEIVLGAVQDAWDTLYIATCDSDMIPAIKYARSCGKKVFLMLPTGAPCYGVGQECDATIEISKEIILDCLADGA